MLPVSVSVSGFPWLAAAAATGFPWRNATGPNGVVDNWPLLRATTNAIFEQKFKLTDGSPTSSDAANDGTECVVCGDKSSGKHYGQFSCEGCKSFFKRSIRRSLSYTCRATKNCAIDVQHRNQCQYCRLKKCIRMGMRKEAVQRGRLPVSLPSFFPPPSPFLRPLNFMPPPPPPPPPIFNQFQKSFESIFEFAAQTIFSTVHWAKTSMASSVHRGDHVALLQNCWTSIFVFALAHSNFNVLACLAGTSDDEEGNGDEHVRALQDKIEKIREFSLDIIEISSLRALLLFNSDIENHEFCEKSKIDEVSCKLKNALEEYCKANKPPMRFSQLEECLGVLRTSRTLPISRIFFARLVGTTPIESIITDLLNMSIPPPAPAMFS
ncbi:unnamed protein product [Caenorhabditis bovis]|uniref:Uncharacterized protein n=1 Tax=Caenorhabditis bovis TaxID=2654633 RepID=A0A8S1F9X1_9PELO|nr:unnamed protein product [Caenorhabditis bovis]